MIVGTQFVPWLISRFTPTHAPLSPNLLYTQITQQRAIISDPLSHPDNFEWNTSTQKENGQRVGGCSFKNKGYHSEAHANFLMICIAQATHFSDLLFEVEMTIVQGQAAGLFIRGSPDNSGYIFRVGTDGTYVFKKLLPGDKKQTESITLLSGSSEALVQGQGHTNLPGILMRDSTFYLFANHTFIDMVQDKSYKSGAVGVFADSHTGPTEARFQNARIWKI
jgi:hypothetical protein